MNAVVADLTFQRWQPSAEDASAEPALQVRGYSAADVVLVPVECAERAGEILRASLPIRVAIERADDGYVAENKRLDIFAFGDDPSGALSEFRSQLFSLYEHYTALSEDEVMGEAAEMRLLFLNKFTLLRTEGR
jgi:hypothetical protein